MVTYGSSGSDVGSPSSGKTAGRSPNGGSIWINNLVPTQGSANSDPTPVPTTTPSPTPDPTVAPTATSTSTPVPTKTPTPSPTKTATPTPKATAKEKVLGATDSAIVLSDLRGSLETMAPENVNENNEKTKIPVVSYVLVSGGVLFIVSALLLYWKKRPKYNNKNEEQV